MDDKKFCPTQKNMENKEEYAIFMSPKRQKKGKIMYFFKYNCRIEPLRGGKYLIIGEKRIADFHFTPPDHRRQVSLSNVS